MLYIVGTPLGNLRDLSPRALEVLGNVDYVVAEDTRVTRKLLSRFHISTRTISFHAHSRERDLAKILTFLRAGKVVAYVVDAGTPGISDPGGYLVRAVSQALPDVPIVPIPGPSALTAALSVSGIVGSSFLFLGFPPHKKGRDAFFKEVYVSSHPVVLYESPHRLLRTLSDLGSHNMGTREIILAKELTKMHEKTWRASPEKLLKTLPLEGPIRGEYVIIVPTP